VTSTNFITVRSFGRSEPLQDHPRIHQVFSIVLDGMQYVRGAWFLLTRALCYNLPASLSGSNQGFTFQIERIN
jgi:hypothetical protein